MADPLTPPISDRICKHMNEDHADAVALYARHYGGLADVSAATLVSVDPQGMNLTAVQNGEAQPLRILFDHPLQDSEDAHQTLIAMVRQARSQPQQP